MLESHRAEGRCYVAALGVTTDAIKVPPGLWDDSTENKTVTVYLLRRPSLYVSAGRETLTLARLEVKGR